MRQVVVLTHYLFLIWVVWHIYKSFTSKECGRKTTTKLVSLVSFETYIIFYFMERTHKSLDMDESLCKSVPE